MRKIFFSALLMLPPLVVVFFSCKKDLSCEGCQCSARVSKPPVAIANRDTIITLPMDSVVLDGSRSYDPAGSIKVVLWRKIAGPGSYFLVNSSAMKTVARNLTPGTYKFELKVTNDCGGTGADTVTITVDAVFTPNHPPVANAGADQVLHLPATTALIDGSASTDPDNNITAYFWSKVTGPAAYTIVNPTLPNTQITNLSLGIYLFELKVTDAGGLFSRDTMKITVTDTLPVAPPCSGANRPQIPAQLVQAGDLSTARTNIAVAAAGNKIVFAGGISNGVVSSAVDILDLTTNTITSANLSTPRSEITAAVLGTKIYLAGGVDGTGSGSTRVDIYDASNNTWSTSELSTGRWKMAGAAAGNKVMFAGGFNISTVPIDNYPTIVDILDVTTNTWSVQDLPDRPENASAGISATAAGNKIYFAGASPDWPLWDFGDASWVINIYDVTSNSWTTSLLSQQKGFMAAAYSGNKIYWAGGKTTIQAPYEYLTPTVEIRDLNTDSTIFRCLFQPNGGFFTNFDAVIKDNKIVFFTGAGMVRNKFDIYDIATDTWSVGVLPQTVENASIISVNNTIYFAGASLNGSLSGQLWKLNF